jgi:hypothetical protein
MGLFNKIFGGKDEPQKDKPAAEAAAPAMPAADGAPVARRERTKRDEVPVHLQQQGEAALQQAAIGSNPLLAAIDAVVQGDNASTRAAVYDAILQAEFYLVLMNDKDSVESGEVTLTPGQQISLATISLPDGKVLLPIFSDLDRLQKSVPPGTSVRHVKLPAQGVFQIFMQGPGFGVVINPNVPPSGFVTRTEAEYLAQGQVPQLNEDGTVKPPAEREVKLALGKPNPPPAAEFVAAVREASAQQEHVREAHIFMAAVEPNPLKLMVGLLLTDDLTEEEAVATFRAVGEAAVKHVTGDSKFDMMPLNGGLDEAVKQLDGLVYRK